MTTQVRLSRGFLALLGGSLGCLLLLYAMESNAIKAGMPEGLLVGIVQCLSELIGAAALLRLWRSRAREDRRATLFLIVGLLAFAVADFSWVYLFYCLRIGRRALPAILLTHIPYGIGYFGLAFSLFRRLRASVPFRTIRNTLAVTLMFTVPFYLRFVALPALGSPSADGNWNFFLAHTFNTFGCFVLMNAAILTIALFHDLRWSMLGVGAACLVMENWAFRAEMLLVGAPTYGFYDYFWAFGILTCVYPLAYRSGEPTGVLDGEVFDPASLRTRTRYWIIGTVR